MITRADILEIIDTDTVKVIRATVDPRIVTNYTGDKSPHPGNIALLLQVGNDPDDLVLIGVEDGVAKTSQPGEDHIYSYDVDGNIMASVKVNKDAETVINQGEDWAVQFTALQTAFDQLQSDHDSLVDTFNTHIHTTTATVGATPTPGVIAPVTITGSPSTADITPAKIEQVRVP